MTWKVFVAALGLAFVIEGIVYFTIPDISRKLIAWLLGLEPSVARRIGLFSILFGLVVLWIASSF